MTYTSRVMADLRRRHSHQPEFLQAVEEVLNTLQPLMDKEPKYEKNKICAICTAFSKKRCDVNNKATETETPININNPKLLQL